MMSENIARGERWEDVYEFSREEHRKWLRAILDDWGLKIWECLDEKAKLLVLMELAPDIDEDLHWQKEFENSPR